MLQAWHLVHHRAVEDTGSGVDLAKKTVCIKMRLSTMGNARKVSTSQIEADADKDLLRVSKHLLDSAELKAIGRFDGEIRRFLYNVCLPFEIDIHLLPSRRNAAKMREIRPQ